MRYVYDPRDREEKWAWDYDPNDVLSVEAEAIERVTGWTYEEFGEHFMRGSTLAKHALLWMLLRRENKGLKFTEVSFRVSEISLLLDDEEIEQMEEAMAKTGDDAMTEDDKKAAQALIDASRKAVAEEGEDAGEASEPDPAPTPKRKRSASSASAN